MTSGINPDDRKLLALVAVFVPGRAERLLSRLGLSGTEPLRAEGVRIATAPRRARLLALAESIAITGAPLAEFAEALASGERPRTAAALRGWSAVDRRGPLGDAISPALLRLLKERLRPPNV